MIIDCHTHIGRNEHIKATAAELVASMDVAKVDKALVFAGHINDCTNKWMLEQIDPYKGRLYGVASVNLSRIDCYTGYNESDSDMSIQDMLTTLNHNNVVAVKLYTGYEHFTPNSDRVRCILDLVAKINKPVIFHTGDCLASIQKAKLKYAQPLDIDDIAVDYPNLNFIIAHMGYPWVKDAAEVCYKNKNVFSDISGFVYGSFSLRDDQKFRKLLSDFQDIVTEKLIFGSDWPISNQLSYVKTIESFSSISMETMTQNAIKIFNLS